MPRVIHITGIPAAATEEIAGVVQGHKGHDQAAEEIDGVKTRSSPYNIMYQR
jgi:hypothetical protein